jgi:hypothetical protein
MQKKGSTERVKSQGCLCPLRDKPCIGIECAIWDCQFHECGILGIGDSLERLVDVLIDRSKP